MRKVRRRRHWDFCKPGINCLILFRTRFGEIMHSNEFESILKKPDLGNACELHSRFRFYYIPRRMNLRFHVFQFTHRNDLSSFDAGMPAHELNEGWLKPVRLSGFARSTGTTRNAKGHPNHANHRSPQKSVSSRFLNWFDCLHDHSLKYPRSSPSKCSSAFLIGSGTPPPRAQREVCSIVSSRSVMSSRSIL